jgi:hypothetical protein
VNYPSETIYTAEKVHFCEDRYAIMWVNDGGELMVDFYPAEQVSEIIERGIWIVQD